jgi:ribosomal protein S18 acetylase RimI-like enzyme
MNAMGTDKRALRIAEVLDVSYSKALDIWRANEGLRLTLDRHSTDEEVREAFRREGLTQYARHDRHVDQSDERLVIIDPSVAGFFDRWVRLHGYVETPEPWAVGTDSVEVIRVHVPGRVPAESAE